MNQRIWTPVDVSRLLDQIKKKYTLAEISKREKRSIPSIQTKLKEIAVDLYFNKNIPYERVEEITGIQKGDLVVKRKLTVPERSGSPKEAELEDIKEPEIIPSGYKVMVSNENPFSIESLSTLILSTVSICLLSSNS